MPDYPHLAICQSSHSHRSPVSPVQDNCQHFRFSFHISFHFFQCKLLLLFALTYVRFSPILNEFSKYDVSHQIDLIRHYHKYYVEHLLHGKYQFRLNVCYYDFIFHVLHKWVVRVIQLNISSLVLGLLGADKVGAWYGMFSAGINNQL